MKTAIITGASSGIGREFAIRISEKIKLDEIWLIARREKELYDTAEAIKIKTRVICLDLSLPESTDALQTMLESENPEIVTLINAAGLGKFGEVAENSKTDIENMINVNIRALTQICRMCIPYMKSGAIINMASVSGFTPLPYLNVYSATKAYVLHFSNALSRELKSKNISVTAVCPYWVASEFIPVAQRGNGGDSINNFMLITYPYAVVRRTFADIAKGKTVSMSAVSKAIKCTLKLLPQKCVFGIWDKVRKLQ